MTPSSPTLGFVLHDVARLLRKRLEQRVRGLGLTRSQWQVLVHLAQHEGINQAGLAEILEIEPITLVRMLDRLEAAGLVERRTHPADRRVRLLHLMPQARPLLETMRGLGELTRAEALAGVPGDERQRLLETLCTMKTNLIRACGSPIEERRASHG
jgi:DNA-binding MarR family transcriptional regulator